MPRINADFPESAYGMLEELAHLGEISKTEVLRRALKLEKIFQDRERDGYYVIFEKPDGTRERLILR